MNYDNKSYLISEKRTKYIKFNKDNILLFIFYFRLPLTNSSHI